MYRQYPDLFELGGLAICSFKRIENIKNTSAVEVQLRCFLDLTVTIMITE